MTDKIAVKINNESDFQKYKERARSKKHKEPWRMYDYYIRYYKYKPTPYTLCFESSKMDFNFSTEDYFRSEWYRIITLEEAMREEVEQTNVQKMHNTQEWDIYCNHCKSKDFVLRGWEMCPVCYNVKKQPRTLENSSTPEFVRGEKVKVSQGGSSWGKRIYLATIEWATYPYVVVSITHENEFRKWEEFDINYFKHIRKLQSTGEVKKFTKQEVKEYSEKMRGEEKYMKVAVSTASINSFLRQHNMLED